VTTDTARDEESEIGSWGELLSRRHLGAMVVLAGGVALYATNVYLTTSLLPSAISDIGGERLYSWSTTIFLLASVMSSVLVSRLLASRGSRRAYLMAIGFFVLGTLLCAAAPSMPVLLLGRALQGGGGGLVAGLGYALIRSTLPSTLWARASALSSAMWGVGTFLGPVLGGAFAQFGAWRGAFLALAAVALAIAAIVPGALAATRPDASREAFPLIALMLLTTAALVVSVASVMATLAASAIGMAVGLLLIGAFVVYERRATVRVLPATTFRGPSGLRWIYATIALLTIGSTTETFVPLFGQRLASLAPLAAGFLGAALAAGWTLGELPSASASRPATTRRIVIAGPIVLAVGLALAALTQRSGPNRWLVTGWVLALMVAGSGIGMAWPHLSTGAMSSVTDPSEGDKASAAINTVQLVANAFGASLTGVAVNLGAPDLVRSAHYLFNGFAVLAALGLATAIAGQHRLGVLGAPTRGVVPGSAGEKSGG
jgi:MFS family permease